MPQFTDNNPLVETESVPPPSATLPLPQKGEVIGQSQKRIFGGDQSKAAGFAGKMIFSNTRMNDIEDSGFDPVNMIDVAKDNMPFVPEWLERMAQSTKYKLYNANKVNFSVAQLRWETGAVINDSEIDWIEETYFPRLGEGPAVQALKREAREEAINAMALVAGAAYQGLSPEAARLQSAADAKERAMGILRRRAQTNPELADQIRRIIRRTRGRTGG